MRIELTKEQIEKILNDSESFDFEFKEGDLKRLSLLSGKVGIHFLETKEAPIKYSIGDNGEVSFDSMIDTNDFIKFEMYCISKELFKEVYEQYRMEQFKKLI